MPDSILPEAGVVWAAAAASWGGHIHNTDSKTTSNTIMPFIVPFSTEVLMATVGWGVITRPNNMRWEI